MGVQSRMQYSPTLGGKYQCPFCFVINGVAADLRITNTPNDGDGVLKCRVCQNDYVIPLD